MDPVAVLREAADRRDATLLAPVLHTDVEFRAPALGRLVVRGADDVGAVFATIFSLVDEMTPRTVVGGGLERVVVVDVRFGRWALSDALLIDLTDDARIACLEPHLRPWPSSSLFIVRVAARLLRERPALLVRALRGR